MLVSDASEDENYIDTSDQEERDELIAGLQLSERSPSNDQLYTSQLFNSYTPRKRRKVYFPLPFHGENNRAFLVVSCQLRYITQDRRTYHSECVYSHIIGNAALS